MHDDDDFPEHLHLDQIDADMFEEVEGLEKFSITSVGIDIGSSTSHLVFSHLTLRRRGADLSTQFEVTDRIVLYRSPILLTPYVSPTMIDTPKLKKFVEETYRQAGFTPGGIDTGAVVITGEALNKENAKPIVEMFAHESGKFICASAGPNHEALLAAHGSGAVALSKSDAANVLNVDIGGGTTKLSMIRDGVVHETAAVSVGARLVAFDESDTITRVEHPARRMMEELPWRSDVGMQISERERQQLAEVMTEVLFDLLEAKTPSKLVKDLLVTGPLAGYEGLDEVDCIVFSGGVSEYVYEHDHHAYGDLGNLLGAAIRTRLKGTGRFDLVREAAEGIRATVIGAGEYTVQASGVTSYISNLDVLPVFGLKVVKAALTNGRPLEQTLTSALRKFDLDRFTDGLVMALAIEEQPNYKLLKRIALGIDSILKAADNPTSPLFLVVDADIAKSLGGILKEELGMPREVIALDGIEVGDLDYIDIGRPMGVSESMPVTVKSLMFPASR